MSAVPRTKYTRLGDDRIAYQVFGDGEIDFLLVTGLGICIDLVWDYIPYANFLRATGSSGLVRGLRAGSARPVPIRAVPG